VHLAGWGHPVLLVTLLIARLYGIPVAVESDTPLSKDHLDWQTRLRRLGHRFLFQMPSVFLPGGSRQAAYLKHYGVDDERIRIAQMTVDVEAIRAHVAGVDAARRLTVRNVLGVESDVTLFLYVGRLEEHKGLTSLVEAFQRVSSARSGLALLLVGDGAQREALAQAAPGCPGLRLAGRLDGKALLDAYAAADVFVLPSRFEPWGLVVNEAMAAGLPVIVSDRVGCIDDLVRPEETGLVVEAERSDALAVAMERLAADADGRARLGAAASGLIAGWTLENEAINVSAAWQSVMVET
jgi:glycosyltransferase involved in cell wall biosynthesis